MTKVCNYTEAEDFNTYELVGKIVKTNRPRKFRKLVEWLIKGGSRFPKCQLRNLANECRATFAREAIKEDEEIMYIPKPYIITSDLSMQSDICQEIQEAFEVNGVDIRSKHTYLAAFLLQEKARGRASQWFPYINILPKDFANIPLFFDSAKLSLLQGSIALQKISDRHDSLCAEYHNLRRYVDTFKKWSYEDFVWARLVVITRIFGLLIDGHKTDGLVPMADMINHKRPRETRWTYNESKQGFIISAMQNFSPGDQIFDSYGRKCNSRFFVNYGFALENNPDNEGLIQVQLPHEAMMNAETQDFQVPKIIDDKKCRAMLSTFRWSVGEYQRVDNQPEVAKPVKGQYIPPISRENELGVLQLILNGTNAALDRFPLPIEHDNLLLQDTQTYPHYTNERNIILMTRGEKEVLHHWKLLAKTGICAMQATPTELSEMTSSITDSNIRAYLKSISKLLK